jgi:uncharacterized protein (DUF1800 family)
MRDDQPPREPWGASAVPDFSDLSVPPVPSEPFGGSGPDVPREEWMEPPWAPSQPSDAFTTPFAPGPDVTPTRVLPGGMPSWAPPAGSAMERAGGRGSRVSRRAVLAGAGVGAMALGAAGAGVGFWLSHQSGAAADLAGGKAAQIFHLLRRAGFGARPGEIGEYLQLGVAGAVDRLLDPAAVADDLDARLARLNLNFSNPLDLQRWFILRMIYSRRPLEEKLTLFWHGVLTSSYREVGGKQDYPLILKQNQLLRAHALGRFDDLIHAVTIDPAMMWYLDLRSNTVKAPNENYARELMELFTLGIADPQGKPTYTQDDVEAGARALTGWRIGPTGDAVFRPALFDAGAKTFLGHSGNLGLNDVVQIVCAHPATPYHLAWRMWSFFAYATTPNDRVLQPLVDAYNRQNHSIAAMLRALLTSPALYGAKAYRQRVKSPAEFVVGAIRTLELEMNGQALPQLLAGMGQEVFNPPNVSGWDGDKDSANWMSTQAWMARVNFVNALLAAASARAGGTVGGASASATPTAGAPALQASIDTRQLATPAAWLDFFVTSLLDNQLADDRRAVVADFLRGAASAAGPSLTLHGGARLPAAAARGALYLLMSMPEYQLN